MQLKNKQVLGHLNDVDISTDEVYTTSELNNLGVKVKGQTPSGGVIIFDNNKVDMATLCIDNYKVEIEDGKLVKSTKVNKCSVETKYPKNAYAFQEHFLIKDNVLQVPLKGNYGNVNGRYQYHYYTDYSIMNSFESPIYLNMKVNPVNGKIRYKEICIHMEKYSKDNLCFIGDYDSDIKQLKKYVGYDEINKKTNVEFVSCNYFENGVYKEFSCKDNDPIYIEKYTSQFGIGYTLFFNVNSNYSLISFTDYANDNYGYGRGFKLYKNGDIDSYGISMGGEF